ncbi:MAG TPA: hypothetical protein VN541_08875 [Tepidisphaeraceae bacterium]|nr:hypothetical protein [Tepidisphaeraceae bacterium]
MINLRHGLVLATFGVAVSVLLAGCAPEQPTAATNIQSAAFDAPPQKLLKEVERIVGSPPIALPAQDEGNGALLTGWQEGFRGQFHIVRYWHERTRYHITIVPDFSDPAHHSRIQVTDETEQRPDDSGPNVEAKTWHPAPGIHRPDRSTELLHRIEQQLTAAKAVSSSSRHPIPAPGTPGEG